MKTADLIAPITSKFPESDFDRSDKVLGLLGSFWSKEYTHRATLERLIQANLEEMRQQHQDLEEIVKCMDRKSVPEHHIENWLPIVLYESEMWEGFGWELPEGVSELPILQNRMTSPSLVWIEGLEYSVGDRLLVFKDFPFDSPLLPKALERRPGGSEDRSIVLWAYKAKIDRNYVYRHFGYMLGEKSATKEQINAIFDIYSRGATHEAVKSAIAMVHGIPTIKEPYEVVEDRYRASKGHVVITDHHVYKLPEGLVPAVYRDQRLPQGTPLVDACVMIEPHRLRKMHIPHLKVPPNLLPEGVEGPLTFPSGDVAVTPKPIRFEIGGAPEDVDAFWKSVDQERLRAVMGDAMAVDPMDFVLKYCLRGNCLFMMKHECCPEPAVPLEPFLRKIVPPNIAVITIELSKRWHDEL